MYNLHIYSFVLYYSLRNKGIYFTHITLFLLRQNSLSVKVKQSVSKFKVYTSKVVNINFVYTNDYIHTLLVNNTII